MKTKNGNEICLEYSDTDIHCLTITKKGTYISIDLSVKDVNELIQELIGYSQSNKEWKDD